MIVDTAEIWLIFVAFCLLRLFTVESSLDYINYGRILPKEISQSHVLPRVVIRGLAAEG